jgi:hypothetical protein
VKKAYRLYVSEALRLISKNTAGFRGGTFLDVRYADILNQKKQDSRSCEEITADIVQRCGLVVKHESS